MPHENPAQAKTYFWPMKYLDELNEAQKQAVLHTEGPVMVIAGAGSGKTKVLTYRLAYLVEKGIDPFQILALTFTNKAAREMKERISAIVGSSLARNLWMGTFHSVFAKILRIECEKIGFPRNFTIYDTADSKNLVKDIIKGMQLDDKIYKPGLVFNRISSAKNNLISPEAYAQNTDYVADDRQSGKPRLHEIYAEYNQRLFRSGAMDFDDLLFKTNVLLRDFPEILNKYQLKFKYILVDEYQDTNYSQYLIVKKLAARNENVCVVGDDSQSIYAFRGADIRNILNFKKDYPDFELYKLEQNYRSTKNIVHAANSVIERNEGRIPKEIWTNNDAGDKIKVLSSDTDNKEGSTVAHTIYETRLEYQAPPRDFAILYRTNAQSRAFEEALRKLNIPYRIYGGLSFYQRKEIKDLLAYFRLTANPNDEEALKRIINYPRRGIGDATIDALVVAASEKQTGIWNVIEEPTSFGLKLAASAVNRVIEFGNMIKSFRIEMERMTAFDVASHIAKTTGLLKELFDDKTPEGVSRYENIQELLNGIKEFTENAQGDETRTLPDFLIDVALLTDADQDEEGGDDKVTLMTIHAAKGLEFPYVFIVGMEENLFPSQMMLQSREDMEEERRLFYVAITRAEKKCWLSYARSRYRWGTLTHGEPSRFIDEIDPAYVDRQDLQVRKPAFEKSFGSFDDLPFDNNVKKSFSKTRKKEEPEQKPLITEVAKKFKKLNDPVVNTSSIATSALSIHVGDNVSHELFGKGKVLAMDGQEPNVKCTVFFPQVGQKQLLLRFAKLTVID
ncbi:MAG: ATP-dependent helicase [Flavobacteriales bacterium]